MMRLLTKLSNVIFALFVCATPMYAISPTAEPNPDFSSAKELSSAANCYIISQPGLYKFKTVKGSSAESVGDVTSASILWETFGTSVAPDVGDLIKSVSYMDGYIAFQTSDVFKEGNALVAAMDANDTILWSWHIWMTDQPEGHVYYNNAGIMMDRNLGATSATPGEEGALGLLYQWGRKDPFLGSSSTTSNIEAKSTIIWPYSVKSDTQYGTIEYAVANPTTMIVYNSNNYDWYYTGDNTTDNTRWTQSSSQKSIYDPCPSGWRIPDGGCNGIWAKAAGSSSYFEDCPFDDINKGINFSGKFGSSSSIWYPSCGCRYINDGSLNLVGNFGNYWSASPTKDHNEYYMSFYNSGYVDPSNYNLRASFLSVRCVQERNH